MGAGGVQGAQLQGSKSASCIQSVQAWFSSMDDRSSDSIELMAFNSISRVPMLMAGPASGLGSVSSSKLPAPFRGGGGGRRGPPSLCRVDRQLRRKCPFFPQAWHSASRSEVRVGGLFRAPGRVRTATCLPFRRSSRNTSPSSVTTSSSVGFCSSSCPSTLYSMGAGPAVLKCCNVCKWSFSVL